MKSRKLKQIRQRLLAACLGGVIGLAAVPGGIAIFSSERDPELTSGQLAWAEETWAQNQPVSYQIEVRVQGPQPGHYVTEVRNGRVVRATFDGQELRSTRTLATWSVEGMFRTVDYDMRSVENAKESEPQLTLRARFDEQFGFPKRYHRIQWGSLNELTWEVIRFDADTAK